MGPKKQVKNGFTCFVRDYRQEQEQLGREMPRAIEDVIRAAAPAWKALGESEKKRYNAMARALNGKRDKMDCTGRLIKNVEREKQEKKDEENRMVQFIEEYVLSLGSREAVTMEKFYIISFNIFCKTAVDMYLPAEVGLVEFSILEGIRQSYHTFINPGDLPVGSKFDCKEKSERTHKIPWLGFELAEENYTTIIENIIDLIDPDHDLPQYPPIYCLTNEMTQTKDLLDMFKRSTNRNVDFAVMDFAQLFFELYCYANNEMISVGVLREFLLSNTYTYQENTSCEWHWKNDCVEHCSLGIVKRTCFIMFDYLCPLYGVTPVLSRHYPCLEETANFSSLSSQRSSSVASSTTRRMSAPSSVRSEQSSDYRTASRDTRQRASCFSSNYESDTTESSYFTLSASPQYGSTSGGSNQTPWKSTRAPSTQSFSAAAAASLNQPSNDFHMNGEDFPGLGRGYGGARPKHAQQPPSQQHALSSDSRSSSESSYRHVEGNADPRTSYRHSNSSESSSNYQRRFPGDGERRFN